MKQIIFGSPVVIIKPDHNFSLTDIYNEMYNFLMMPENKNIDHPYTKGGKICTTDLNSTILSKIKSLESLIEFLKRKGIEHAHLFSNEPVKNLVFDNMWINLTFFGCEIQNHYDRYQDYNEKNIIMLFYIKAPVNSSNLVFIHNSKYGDWASEQEEKDLVKIEIEEGNIVIIDNHILHAVDAQLSAEPRMCIATEFKIET